MLTRRMCSETDERPINLWPGSSIRRCSDSWEKYLATAVNSVDRASYEHCIEAAGEVSGEVLARPEGSRDPDIRTQPDLTVN